MQILVSVMMPSPVHWQTCDQEQFVGNVRRPASRSTFNFPTQLTSPSPLPYNCNLCCKL